MKKAILSIHEKRERIVIRYKRKQKRFYDLCEECGKQFDRLPVNEPAQLTEKDSEDIQQNLKTIRNKNK